MKFEKFEVYQGMEPTIKKDSFNEKAIKNFKKQTF